MEVLATQNMLAVLLLATPLNKIFEEGAGAGTPAEATEPREPSSAAAFVGRR